jgi:hypothetical protein
VRARRDGHPAPPRSSSGPAPSTNLSLTPATALARRLEPAVGRRHVDGGNVLFVPIEIGVAQGHAFS